MKILNHITLILLFMLTANSWASAPPEGVSSEQWISIQQQIAASKYRPQPLKDGYYTALNAAQGWQVKHAPDGMTTLKNDHFSIGMKLNSIGSQQIAGAPKIEVKDDNLYYYHSPTIKEWWVNSADKTEQWFSLRTRPITGNHEIKVGIELDTNTTVTQVDNQLVFTANNGQKINYDRLKVWDAHGKVLPSRMQLADGSEHFNLIVDDRLAAYPITIDPSFTQDNYIKPAVTDVDDNFGRAVDLDGIYMVVGVPNEDSGSTLVNGDSSDNSAPASGAAYIFKKVGINWVQEAYLKASNAEAGDRFGESVAISGNTVVVGAVDEEGDANSTSTSPNNNQPLGGAVYVFKRSGTTWSQQDYLKPHDLQDDQFGTSVDIDGYTIVVGSKSESGDANSTVENTNNNAGGAGAAYVFTPSGSTWSQSAYLKASNAEAGDWFGQAVAINADILVIGAVGESGDANSTINAPNNAASDSGAVYIFVREGDDWFQQGYLKAHNAEAEDDFGYGVGVNGDTVVVGAYREDGDANSTMSSSNNNATNAGAAYVYVRENETWTQQAYLKASNADNFDYFAQSVDIAGETIVIGALNESGDASSTMVTPNNSSPLSGAVYVFARNHADWKQKNYLKAENTDIADKFGQAVGIDKDYIIIGATNESGDANSTAATPNNNTLGAGAVYVFDGRYFVGGQVVGLPFGGPLELSRNGTELLTVTNNGAYQFPTEVLGSSPYTVSISSAPAGYTCSIINASGSLNYDDITDANVFCSTNSFSVGGSVSGLTGTGLVLRNNGIFDVIINSNGSFSFTPDFADGTPYNVVVQTQPSGGQTCNITNGSGTVSGADVTDVAVVCVDNTYFIGGSVSGLSAPGLVLQNNGSDDLNIMSNGGFVFDEPLNNGSNYAVSISAAPNSQTCSVSNGSGTVAGDDVIDVMVNCADNTYLVGVNVSGLTGPGLVLQNNGGDDLTITQNGITPFDTELADGESFQVTIATQPNNPQNTCETIGVSSGVIDGNNRLVFVECGNDLIFNNGFE